MGSFTLASAKQQTTHRLNEQPGAYHKNSSAKPPDLLGISWSKSDKEKRAPRLFKATITAPRK